MNDRVCNEVCNGEPEPVSLLGDPSVELPAKQPHPDYPDRWADGTVRAGHPGPALKHGARSALVAAGALPSQSEAVAVLRERAESIASDLGGAPTLSAVALGQVQRHVKLELVEGTLWENLVSQGTLTGKGKTRAATMLWLQVLDRIQRSAAVLGLEKKARDVRSLSAAEYLAQEHRS